MQNGGISRLWDYTNNAREKWDADFTDSADLRRFLNSLLNPRKPVQSAFYLLFLVKPGIHPVRDEAVVEGADGIRIRVGAPLRGTLREEDFQGASHFE